MAGRAESVEQVWLLGRVVTVCWLGGGSVRLPDGGVARCQQGAYVPEGGRQSFLPVHTGAAGRPGLRLLMRRTLHSHFSGGPPFSLWPF